MQPHKKPEIEQRLAEDLDWAEHTPEVQQNPEHFGKLVAVYNKRILAVGRDRQAVMTQAARQAGVPEEQLVVVLVPRPDLGEIPD